MRVKVVTVMRWYAQDEVNQEEVKQNEVDRMKEGADSTGEVMFPLDLWFNLVSMVVVAWFSGNMLVSINVVTLRRPG